MCPLWKELLVLLLVRMEDVGYFLKTSLNPFGI